MQSFLIALVNIGLLLLGPGNQAGGPVLVEASPGVDSVQESPPVEVRLRFDRPLNEEGSSLQITDEAGDVIAIDPATVSPSDQTVLSAPLPTLLEGTYTVHYQLATLGNSTISVDRYQFTIDLPPPVLSLTKPLSGQSFPEGAAIPLQMQTRFFDFELYENRVRVYVDGSLQDEIRSLNYPLTGLSPGVHEVKLVLAQAEDTEFPETANIIYVAVTQPGAESEIAPDSAPNHALLPALTWRQAIVAILVLIMVVASGIWLGRELYLADAKDKSAN
jgi:methionine-rich copper-binding protein CopC